MCKDVSASFYYDCKNTFTQCKSNKEVTLSDCENASATQKSCFDGSDGSGGYDADNKCFDYNRNTKKWGSSENEDECGVEGANAQYYDKCSFAKRCPIDAPGSGPTCANFDADLQKACFLNEQLPFTNLPLVPCSSFDPVNKTWKAHNAFIGPQCVNNNVSRYAENCNFNEPGEDLYGIKCPDNLPTSTQFTDSICPALKTFLDEATSIDPDINPVEKKKAQTLAVLLGGCLDPENNSFKTGGCRQFYNETEHKWTADDLCDNLCNRIIDGSGVNVSFYKDCIPFVEPPPPSTP